MSPVAFAWRSLASRPARAALGVAGIAIIGALLFDMLLLSRGLQVSFRELLDAAGFDVRVTATDALPGSGPPLVDGVRLVERLAAEAEIDEAVGLRFGRAEIRTAASAEESPAQLFGATDAARSTWTVIEGHGPARAVGGSEPPVLVNRALATALGVAPGAELLLRGACAEERSALPAVRFRVSGIADFRFAARGDTIALVRLGDLVRACDLPDPDALDMILVASAPGVDSAATVESIGRALPGLHAFSNRQLVDRLEVSNFSYFRQVSFALSTVTLFFAFLLTTTLLTVSVNQRLGEVAGLRALGFARRRVVANLVCESALLVGAGGVLSLPLGAALAAWLDAILRGMPGLPERLHFFVFQPRAVALHAALLLATGVLAALYPVYLAARLPIAATLRRETVS